MIRDSETDRFATDPVFFSAGSVTGVVGVIIGSVGFFLRPEPIGRDPGSGFLV